MRGWWIWIVAAAVFLIWPDEFDLGGLLGDIAVILGVALVVTPFAVYHAILKSLPEQVELSQAEDHETPGKLGEIISAFEHLGFQRMPPVRVHLPNEAFLVPLCRPQEGMYATVYQLQTSQGGKIAYDVVSMLDAPDGSLTTAMDHGAGVLPSGPAMLRQIFAEADAEELVYQHRESLKWLQYQRVPTLDVAPSAVYTLLQRSFHLNRQHFLKDKVGNTLTALWRTITRRNPHLGPLMDQKGIVNQLQELPRRRPRRRAGV